MRVEPVPPILLSYTPSPIWIFIRRNVLSCNIVLAFINELQHELKFKSRNQTIFLGLLSRWRSALPSTAGATAAGSPALRRPLWQQEGGETSDRCVPSRRVFEFFISGEGAAVAMRIKVLEPALNRCSSSDERRWVGVWSRSSCIRYGVLRVCLRRRSVEAMVSQRICVLKFCLRLMKLSQNDIVGELASFVSPISIEAELGLSPGQP